MYKLLRQAEKHWSCTYSSIYVSTGMGNGWRELYNVIYDKVQICTFYVRTLLYTQAHVLNSNV